MSADLTALDFLNELIVKTVDSIEHTEVVGNLIEYSCPYCHNTAPLNKYEGNIVEGLRCPSCQHMIDHTLLKSRELSDHTDTETKKDE